jgi:hypothetical protein
VRTFSVVFLAVLRAKHSCFEEVTEDLSAEEFIPERAIEALDVAVFPRSTRGNEPSFDIELRQMIPNRIGHKFCPVIASDEGRSSAFPNQPVQHVDYTGRGHRSTGFEGRTFTGMLIDDRHPLEPAAIIGGVKKEVIRPHVIRERGFEPDAAVCATTDTAPLPCFPAMRKSVLAPEAVYPLGVDLLAFSV